MEYLTEDRNIKVFTVRHLLKQTFELHQMAIQLARESGLYTEVDVSDTEKKLTIYSYDIMVNIMRDYFCIDFTLRKRERNYADAKHIACYILKKYTTLSTSQIALITGNTNHTTAIYAVKKIEDLLTIGDIKISNDVENISAQIEERFKKASKAVA